VDLVLRATAGFFLVFLITRVVGKRELSGLEPFDLILLVVMGDLIQQGMTQDDYSVTGAVLVVGTIAVLTVAVSYVNFRVPPLRRVIEGEPVILIEDGRPIEKNLRRERLTLEELAAEARQQQIASLEDVRWVVLETAGKLSFIPKQK
jgi:uncharacterized membrane protein YcaP (DUF421 family)